jgi:uncharacterized protein (DUF486 family)
MHVPVLAKTAGLLVLPNVFMSFAWYAHLRNLSQRLWIVAAVAGRGIAPEEEALARFAPPPHRPRADRSVMRGRGGAQERDDGRA